MTRTQASRHVTRHQQARDLAAAWWCFAIAAILAALMFLWGCGGWQKTAATSIQVLAASADTVHRTSRPAWHRRCLAVAKACTVRADQCTPLQACQAKRAKFNAALKKVVSGIDAARVALVAALAADSATGWQAKVTSALASLATELGALRAAGKQLGVL